MLCIAVRLAEFGAIGGTVVYGIPRETFERLPLQVKASLAIGWASNDIGARRDLWNFFNSLGEDNQQLLLQGLYARAGYWHLINQQ